MEFIFRRPIILKLFMKDLQLGYSKHSKFNSIVILDSSLINFMVEKIFLLFYVTMRVVI